MSKLSDVSFHSACLKPPAKVKKAKEPKPKATEKKDAEPAAAKEETPAENGEPKPEEVERACVFALAKIWLKPQFSHIFCF